jgi:hypothetical protein
MSRHNNFQDLTISVYCFINLLLIFLLLSLRFYVAYDTKHIATLAYNTSHTRCPTHACQPCLWCCCACCGLYWGMLRMTASHYLVVYSTQQ